MQFLDPLPTVLRDYSSKVARLGEDGEGFAALIREIEKNGSKPRCSNGLRNFVPTKSMTSMPLKVSIMISWLLSRGQQGIPRASPLRRNPSFYRFSSRLLPALHAEGSRYRGDRKGLHPSRLRLLLELMRSQSKRTGTQVFATTHSPTLLAWLTEEDRKTTFVCIRDAESGATKMRSLAEVPKLEELIQENYSLDQLFEEGWLESVLHES